MKITKCPDMTIHKDIQCAALHKLDVHIAGITEDQGKGINGGCPPVWLLNLKITEINLGLPARFGLKSYEGQTGLLLFLFPS